MNSQERKVIDDLFDKLSQAQRQGSRPEPMAEGHIRARIEQQPEAPYLMAQTIVAQEHALGVAQARIAEFEAELARRPAGGGGFLAGLFGGGAGQGDSPRTESTTPSPMQPASNPAISNSSHFGRAMPQAQPGRGGGFLAGTAQTAMGVAGGVLIGSMLGNAFGGGDRSGHGNKAEATPAAAPETVASNESGNADAGDYAGDFGGDAGGDGGGGDA